MLQIDEAAERGWVLFAAKVHFLLHLMWFILNFNPVLSELFTENFTFASDLFHFIGKIR
jgi:hypothetical protein